MLVLNVSHISVYTMKTVYIGMTADIMHPGLINIINVASGYGELTVGLLVDSAIASHKRIPYLTYEQRKGLLRTSREWHV